ncbi:MAG: GGDEF domain-containing protein, partial [Primorskyibacter sp.]
MTLPLHTLDVLCPMHAAVSGSGHIRRTGPTLAKLRLDGLVGRRFLEVFEVQRPRGLKSMSALLNAAGRKLHLRLRDTPQTALKAVLVPDGAGGGVVNFSFGISLVEAVSEYALTNHDFDPTDLSVEMLYLIEAKSAAMAATHRLNTRLQVAWEAAEEQAMTDTL